MLPSIHLLHLGPSRGERSLINGCPSEFSFFLYYIFPDPVQGSRTEGVGTERLVNPPRRCLIFHIGVFNYNSGCLTIQQFIIPLASWGSSHLFTSRMYIKLGQRRWYHSVSCHTRSIPQTHFSPLLWAEAGDASSTRQEPAAWGKARRKKKTQQDPKFIAVAKIFTPPRRKADRGSRLARVRITGKMSRAKRDT